MVLKKKTFWVLDGEKLTLFFIFFIFLASLKLIIDSIFAKTDAIYKSFSENLPVSTPGWFKQNKPKYKQASKQIKILISPK